MATPAPLAKVKMLLLPLLCMISLPAFAATPFDGTPWCSVPPLPGSGLKSNLLLLIDNSASMWDLAYDRGKHCSGEFPSAPCRTDNDCGSGKTCLADAPPNYYNYCIDDSYRDGNSYAGYFDQNKIYRFDSAGARFEPDSAAPQPGAVCIAPCVVSTSYLHLEMVGSAPHRTAQNFKASGNFLNWLSMSKLDLEKQALTGGKYDASGVLVGESRGCQGKKFVKLVYEAPQVTFLVGGPDPEPAPYLYEYLYGHGGATKIEIYDKQYNKSSCLAAIKDWQTAAAGTAFRDNARKCMGDQYMAPDGCDYADPCTANSPGYPVASLAQTYVDVRSNCSFTPTNPTGDGSVLADCLSRLRNKYPGGPISIPQYNPDDVCAKGIPHPPTGNGGTGYLGEQYKLGLFLGAITKYRSIVIDYCTFLASSALTDPSAQAIKSGTTAGNLPGFLLDVGIYPLGAAAGTFPVRVSASAPPTGVIQSFGSDINFGVMVFNDNGAGAECTSRSSSPVNSGVAEGQIPCVKHCKSGAADSGRDCYADADCTGLAGYSCQELPRMDGGKVIAAVGSAVGDHESGVVAAVDRVTAAGWSPLAESFYDAIGYFAGRIDLRLHESDFPVPSPAQLTCQRNNVLIVSDGISTADRHAKVSQLVDSWKGVLPAGSITAAGDARPPFLGSCDLDDLAWLARNRSISDFRSVPASAKEQLTTYVIYTGLSCGAYNADGSCQTTDEGVPEKLMQLTASKGGGKIAAAQNPSELKRAFHDMLQDIAAGSGSDAAIFATGDGNGALYLQEQFYPRRSFDDGTSAAWLGEMQSLWYYIDPFLGDASGAGSTIREDTDRDRTLKLRSDRIVTLDTASNLTYLTVDTNGDGRGGGSMTQRGVDQLESLWRAGQELWKRDPATSPRRIRTTVNGSSLIDFSAANASLLARYLNVPESEAGKLVKYIHGSEQDGYRKRTVSIKDPVTGVTSSGVWKLGDIISSSPQVQGAVPLGSYHLPAPRGYGDASYALFAASVEYRGRGMVYVGANDGMLHAFSLGQLDGSAAGEVQASLGGTDLGKESWSFVPKNALPYLRYLADPGYRHLYYVDGTLTLVDANIGEGNAWRTVLIGGMGLGGASAAGCAAGSDCVATPVSGAGYSSYFALDVTDPEDPSLLWEFSDPELGFATSGPAVVKSGGKWFAVFGSGPTGPIDTVTHQFLGRSSQTLKFFIVELKSGAVARMDTRIDNAFAGSLSGGAIDTDKWNAGSPGFYADDAVYAGYTSNGTEGGVLRIVTNESDPTLVPWSWSRVVEGTGPVTGAIARIQDRKNHHLWLYFGSGRYFYNQDDMAGARAFYGVKEPCYHVGTGGGVVPRPDRLDPSCTRSASVGSPGGIVTDLLNHLFSSGDGWRIDLAGKSETEGAERVIGSPMSTAAGVVLFPSYQPSSDPCHPGSSYLWQVLYDSGGEVPAGRLHGKALMALSSGNSHEIQLDRGGRRAPGVVGKPGGLRVVTNSGLRPQRRIIHIHER